MCNPNLTRLLSKKAMVSEMTRDGGVPCLFVCFWMTDQLYRLHPDLLVVVVVVVSEGGHSSRWW